MSRSRSKGGLCLAARARPRRVCGRRRDRGVQWTRRSDAAGAARGSAEGCQRRQRKERRDCRTVRKLIMTWKSRTPSSLASQDTAIAKGSSGKGARNACEQRGISSASSGGNVDPKVMMETNRALKQLKELARDAHESDAGHQGISNSAGLFHWERCSFWRRAPTVQVCSPACRKWPAAV